MNTLTLDVLSPNATVFHGSVEAVIAPLPDGWQGVLPGHARFSSRLMAGPVVVRIDGQERRIATTGGVLSVDGDSALILTGAAALDRDFDDLEQGIREHIERLVAAEKEAERHFSRVYRQMAHAFSQTG